MNNDLHDKTDVQLTMIFAKEVANLLMPEYWETRDHPFVYRLDPKGVRLEKFPHYAQNLSAVLPWLEKFAAFKVEYVRASSGCQHRVDVFPELDSREPSGWGLSQTLATAAVIALIRAKRSGHA